MDADLTEGLRERVREAADAGRALCVRGGDTKAFYGRRPVGEPLETAGHRGILAYEPTELVLTARGGTPVSEIREALAAQGQMLPFDPPLFGGEPTIGGAVAAGLAGPRRPWGGAPRDLVLGVRILDGRGRVMRFGGQVMKNVAGYDIARLMAGAMGTLGVLLEISLKVLPRPALERTLVFEKSADRALAFMREAAGRPLPLTGAAHVGERLYLRLAGSEEALAGHRAALGGELSDKAERFWEELRDHRLGFFADRRPLWRLSVPPATPVGVVAAPTLTDWAGAQRWVRTEAPGAEIRQRVAESGGHAILFRHGDREGPVFQPLQPALAAVHRRLKAVFDPGGVLNPGRLYPDL
jgi:glycolate oxidase FAD binding subunit